MRYSACTPSGVVAGPGRDFFATCLDFGRTEAGGAARGGAEREVGGEVMNVVLGTDWSTRVENEEEKIGGSVTEACLPGGWPASVWIDCPWPATSRAAASWPEDRRATGRTATEVSGESLSSDRLIV